jgi:hypothetical protein
MSGMRLAAALLVMIPSAAAAQPPAFELGGQIAVIEVGEFDANDTGGGIRAAWRPQPLIGVEAEVNFFLSDFAPGGSNRPGISGSRIEALFGATVGPRVGAVRWFGRARPGLVRYGEAGGPIACILIFPPPLSCQLAAGQTLFAFDAGGGMEVDIGPRMLFRLDIGDRMVKYPEPNDLGHDLRVGIGWAFRF